MGKTSRSEVPPGLHHWADVAIRTALNAFCVAPSLREQVDNLAKVLKLVRERDKHSYGPGLVALLEILDGDHELGQRVSQAVTVLLQKSQTVHLVAEVGLPNDRGFVSEILQRVLKRVLPQPRDDEDISNLLLRLVPSHDHFQRWQATPKDVVRRAAQWLSRQWPPTDDVDNAFRLLHARIQALGLSEKLRARSLRTSDASSHDLVPVKASAFFRLSRLADALLEAKHSGSPATGIAEAWHQCAVECTETIEGILATLERTGVSVDVVFSIDTIQRALIRAQKIALVLVAPPQDHNAMLMLLNELIQGKLEDTHLSDVAANNLRLLGRKIVERAGQTGEHYITSTRSEYRKMWLSAAGGGLLTVATASIKLRISSGEFPLFVEGMLCSINYAISFILLQLFGFTLATKQPSMTAAHLAGMVRDMRGRAFPEKLAQHTARIMRSQLAAAMGNVIFVTLGALVFGWAYAKVFQTPFLNEHKAESVIRSLSPVTTGTFYYAAITGVILWLSSLAGGWLDNWVVYHRIPEALSELERSNRWVRFWHRKGLPSISSWGGSVSLGLMLGMTPVIGQFFGLPIDVRHVTLSTGALVLAVVSHVGHATFSFTWLMLALLGISMIFLLNLSVSFGLALLLALGARGATVRDRVTLRAAFWRHLTTNPKAFFWPPAESSVTEPKPQAGTATQPERGMH